MSDPNSPVLAIIHSNRNSLYSERIKRESKMIRNQCQSYFKRWSEIKTDYEYFMEKSLPLLWKYWTVLDLVLFIFKKINRVKCEEDQIREKVMKWMIHGISRDKENNKEAKIEYYCRISKRALENSKIELIWHCRKLRQWHRGYKDKNSIEKGEKDKELKMSRYR